MSLMRTFFVAFPLVVTLASVALGAEPRIDVESAPCLQVRENAVVKALVTDNLPETTARLYFRRLHEEVEDFYWVEMEPMGNGEHWGVLPKPQNEVLERREAEEVEEQVRERWAAWWRLKEQLPNS